MLAVGLSACGGSQSKASESPSSASPAPSGLQQMSGITATGTLGKKPKLAFSTPRTVKNNTYEIVQQGNGDPIAEGDRVCAQSIAINPKNGSQLMSSWEKDAKDCSLVVSSKQLNAGYYQLFKGQKLNTTIAFGVQSSSSQTSTSSAEPISYIMAMTFVSKSKALTRAQGDKVTSVPEDLPKVTLASDGKPSLKLNGYKPGKKLVAQTLIKGKGATVKATSTVSAHYTGWLASNGKQFDSSWDKGVPVSFSLAGQVVKGWTQGLAGQTVGSQVLLVIPPDLGYGSQAAGPIPANSTLIFVIDILAAY